MEQKKTIAVVGLGYVGLPLALLADRKGFRVIGIDVNPEKIRLISEKKSPFVDQRIEAELPNALLEATGDFSRIAEAEIVIICVPTPVYENHMPNLEPVEAASRGIAKYLKKGQLVILESTVNPGVSETVVLPILEKESGLTAGADFSLAHCPERINPGDPRWHVENIPRVVGALDKDGLERAAAFYRSILASEVRPMGSLKEAEAVKVVENAFRDINIAFVNELAMSFAKLGIDVVNVINGAATKPFAFMPHFPGCGVGGHCIPVDPYYLIEYAKENGFQHEFLSLARKINSGMPDFTVGTLEEGLKEKGKKLQGAAIAVLGVAYKADIDDSRESPSYEIVHLLRERGAEVRVYDPHVPADSTVKTLEDALRDADGAVIATAHKEFKGLTPEVFKQHGVGIIVDGRNCLSKEDFVSSGLVYKGIGR